jgi:hypothetical protein
MKLFEELIARWKQMGIDVPPGVPQEAIAAFEAFHRVAMPQDLRECFIAVDGMREIGVLDDSLFNFRPLSALTQVTSNPSDSRQDRPAAAQYFVLADCSISLPEFAIRLNADAEDKTPIATVFSDAGVSVIADRYESFSEFIRRYLDDPLEVATRYACE